ncbi:hypothetical protein AWRIB429_1531 [Oenococcus oeni AWRIB429]|uniref:Uncharacterized protein n=1 Tax=Oenococcus oeni AWRIB429 TaxID=655225 RepID=D3LB01_OENOE|nr:hypothetical protein AWRIB429_1531 [Oenococcus oeni AWRIB429]
MNLPIEARNSDKTSPDGYFLIGNKKIGYDHVRFRFWMP